MAITVYRLSAAQWAGDLSGEGARLYGGRWNERGTPALYTAPTLSLALLENLVHVGDLADVPVAYMATVIEVIADIEVDIESLPSTKEQAQRQGQALLQDSSVLGFWVPSVIVPHERNLILNPRHAAFAQKIKVIATFKFSIDERLRQ